jgi:hypothetical protein
MSVRFERVEKGQNKKNFHHRGHEGRRGKKIFIATFRNYYTA